MTAVYFPLPQGAYGYTSPYGYRTDPLGRVVGQSFHRGVDIAGPKQAIYAWVDGVITVPAFEANGAGNNIWIRDADNVLWKVFHLDSIAVRTGERVVAGVTVIGVMGTTGASTGVHAHIERWLNGTQHTDPTPFLQEAERAGRFPGKQIKDDDAEMISPEAQQWLQQELSNQDARTKAYIDATADALRNHMYAALDQRAERIEAAIRAAK